MINHNVVKGSVLFAAALSYFVIGVIHPMELKVGDDPDLYLGIHVVQLFSIWGMAAGMWFLTQGIDNKAARVARAAILPYAIFYSAFDAIAGVAIGVVVMESNAMPAADQETMVRFMDNLTDSIYGYFLYFSSGLAWLTAAVATSLSLRGRVHFAAIAMMVIGSAIFAVGHPFPPGPVGITLFVAGLTWFHLSGRSSGERPALVMANVSPVSA